ncbi:hypothetical protein [Streptomyces collinus]|uniref:hypothetical protein n=1 Tax=Streptomyces collinus TaxID=42684 RepID=UPI0029432D7C|nr:hypothetical protein [Streptomyces collinus]
MAIVDLGVHGGSGRTLVRYEDDHSRWRVLRDSEITGSIRPEHSLHGTSLLGWSARTSYAMALRPPHGQKHFANREQAAGAVIRHQLTTAGARPTAAVAASLAALDEPAQDALVAAVIPLAGHRHGRTRRQAGPASGRGLHRRPAHRAAGARRGRPGPAGRPRRSSAGPGQGGPGAARRPGRPAPRKHGVREGTGRPGRHRQGRRWRLEPDPHYLGGYRVLADGADVGAIAPVRRRKSDALRWAAVHRRRSLGRGPSHGSRESAVRAVMAAEEAWVPLPDLDDDTYRQIPAALRSALYDAAARIDPRRGRLAQIQPGAYRQQLHAAIAQARRTDTARIGGQHLAILLDAAREDLGAPASTPAQQLYDVIQESRTVINREATVGR